MITINPELQSLIPPLTAEEYAQLEANILADGCKDALVVWQERQTLLDGHHRYEICERHALQHDITELSLPDFESAKAWMIANQLGRRNLTPEQMRYFRGEQYNLQKRQGKRTDLTSHHHDGKSQTTAQALADRHKVGKATIERDAAYARAVDTIAEAVGPEIRQAILARDAKIGRQDVRMLAAMVTTSPESAKEVIEAVRAAPTPKAAKAVLAGAASTEQVETLVGLETLLQEALRSLEALKVALQVAPLPEALDEHTDVCIHLAKRCNSIVRLVTTSPAVAEGMVGPPPTPVEPPSQESPSTPRSYGALTAQVKQGARELGRFTNAMLAKHLNRKLSDTFKVLKRLVERGELRKEGEEYVMEQPVEVPA